MSDESDSEEHYYSGSEEGDESRESDSDDENHGLLDLEASEGSSDPESDADQLSDGGSYTEYSFPKFMQLPPEIREMVWAAFCPDLGPEPRVFELHLRTVISPPGAVHLPLLVHGIVGGPHLESQTAPMRAVMAVHRESRALGLKSAPNELSLSRGEVVHYHEERDVLFVQWNDDILLRGIALRFQELGIEAQNLAFPSDMCHSYADEMVDLMYLLPQTRRVFILEDEDDLYCDQDADWAVTGMVHKYRLDVEEEGPTGLADQISRTFCWPDLDNNRGFAEENIAGLDGDSSSPWPTTAECRLRLRAPLENSRELNDDDLPDEEKTEAVERLQNIEVWPMIRFNFEEGLDQLKEMERKGRVFSPYEWGDASSVFSDVYESEGIYDGPLDDSSSIDDEDTSIIQDLAHRLFPRPSNQLFDNSSEIDELPSANFSSDEEIEDQDPVVINSDSEDESASQTRATRPRRRVVASDSDESETEMDQTPEPSKRRSFIAISDSVDDEDEGSSDAAGPVRRANRRAPAIPIDSADEEGQDDDTDVPQPSRADRRRARAVPVDSDEEEDEEGEGVQKPSGGRKSRGRVVQDESDEEDDESDSQGGGVKTKDHGSSDDEEQSSSDDEDDEPPPPKRMSLAKRLRMESKSKQARPRQVHDDDDSEADGVNGDGYDYSDDQEDEVDNSDGDMGTGLAEFYKGDDYGSD